MTTHIQHLPVGVEQKALSPTLSALQPTYLSLCKAKGQPTPSPPHQTNPVSFLATVSQADVTMGFLRSAAFPRAHRGPPGAVHRQAVSTFTSGLRFSSRLHLTSPRAVLGGAWGPKGNTEISQDKPQVSHQRCHVFTLRYCFALFGPGSLAGDSVCLSRSRGSSTQSHRHQH